MLTEHVKPIILFAAAKGTAVGVVTHALDIGFLKSLAVAAVSGGIGAAGAIIAARIALKEARKTRTEVRDVSRKVEADRRETDHNNEAGD